MSNGYMLSYVLPDCTLQESLIDAVESWTQHLKELNGPELLRQYREAAINVSSGLIKYVAKETACRAEINKRLATLEEIQRFFK